MHRAFIVLLSALASIGAFGVESFDLVVYGGTPAGLSAAVQAKRMGLSVVVIEPTGRIGGLTTGGLGRTDIGDKAAYGGIAREFYADVASWYRDEAHWTRETRGEYTARMATAGDRRFVAEADTMWCFEPSAALAILEGWMRRDGIRVARGERLDRGPGGVRKSDGRIEEIRMEGGAAYCGRMFVDATYEGDLMAAAGVSYTVGREGNAVYGETINGIQRGWRSNQLMDGIDPYVVKGDKSSGLLPCVEKDVDAPDGSGDGRVQAYCYRMCLTDDPANRIPFEKPEGFDELDYELFFRNCEQGADKFATNTGFMPNRKTDTNNSEGFSLDFVGQSDAWPEASYAEREKIALRHLRYQQGLMWVLANHPRTPAAIRAGWSKYGLCKDEFSDGYGGGWQRQLYVREARRMVGEYVMTEHERRLTRVAPRPVAVGSYQMDSHNCRRHVGADGFVHNEGDVQIGSRFPRRVDGREMPYQGFGFYGIDYGAIIPKRAECANLLVPVCVSASHVAYGSIRMEPVFFTLGQAAATGAALALADGCAVQDVDYAKLRARLAADGQVLPEKLPGTDVESHEGRVRGIGRVRADYSPSADGGSRIVYTCEDESAAAKLATKRMSDLLSPGDIRSVGGVLALDGVGAWKVAAEGSRVVETFERGAFAAKEHVPRCMTFEGVAPPPEIAASSFDRAGIAHEIEVHGPDCMRAAHYESANGIYDAFVATRMEERGPGVAPKVSARFGFFLPGHAWTGIPPHDFAPMESVMWLLPRPDVARSGMSWLKVLTAPSAEVMDMVHHNPGEPLIVSVYNDPGELAARGYDAMVVNEFVFPQCAVTFDAFDPRVFPEGSESRTWVVAQRKRMREKATACHAAGLKCYYFMDIAVLPERLVALHRDELCDRTGRITFAKPMTERVHRMMLDELFTVLPELDGVVVRTGETYLNNTPWHVGNGPCDYANDLEGSKEVHVRLLNLLRDEVCVKKNRRVYYRTWDFGYFHTRPEYYLSVADRVAPHENLFLSVKHTKGDYLRTFAFNPTLGIGRHRQVVEVQCAREYEGKGAFPNYIGASVVDGFEENDGDPGFTSLGDFARSPLFAGVWTWSRGGGSHGPFLKNEFWCDMNARVLADWAKNPEGGEKAAFDRFAERAGVAPESREAFRRLCLLSQRAIIRGRGTMLRKGKELPDYMKEPANWMFVGWSRDDCLGGEAQMKATMDGLIADGLLDARISEMEESARLWGEMVALADSIACADNATREYLRTSSRYGEALHRVIWHGCAVVYKGYEAKTRGIARDEAAIAAHAQAYDEAWADFYRIKATRADCASLYCDEYPKFIAKSEEVPDGVTHVFGLGESVRRYRAPRGTSLSRGVTTGRRNTEPCL
ncbi:MAG: FAD-dependent oxidoreductase [Kiritimatiellae bacterium]|nr:FAD-dependent oxidoreductase [Kiritimatiellia bacterium]